MLRPSKHAHPDRTVVNVALFLLGLIKDRRAEQYGVLLEMTKKVIAGGNVLFLPALNLLYLLGLIEYRAKNDVIEYVGPNDTV